VRKKIASKNLILLSGSATDKMLKALGKPPKDPIICESLAECFDAALARGQTYRKAVILFSPAAKSFEKFTNEFDRGEQFNALVRRAHLKH
jgi:UDP-N-acetylmuramoylalanine--D-glutamate ligase